MNPDRPHAVFDLLVLQLADSAFPAAGFTHSSGLEAAVRHGHVCTAADVSRVAVQVIRQAGRGSLPLVAAAHQEPARLPALDALADLSLNHPVSNRASRAQGRALAGSATRIFATARRHADLQALADRTREGALFGHQAPIFGAVLAYLGVGLETTLHLFLYQSGRSVTTAAVRLGVVGGFVAQQVQVSLAVEIGATIDACAAIAPADVAQTAPLLDLVQSTHDRIYSRLFQS
jgi:urease accessory protein